MKIAFVNNMNNNFFSTVRFLRKRGIDAHLFIFDHIYDGFFPKADTFEDVTQLNYIHLIAQASFKDFFKLGFSFKLKQSLLHLKKTLSDFDLVFACGMLAFFQRFNIPIDVFVPYGGDVYQLTDLFNYSKKKYFPYSILMRHFMKYQQQAIKNVRAVVAFASNDQNMKNALHRMERDWIDWSIPMIFPVNSHHDELWNFLDNHDFILFSHMRQTWKTGTDYNGNERPIKAYAKFIKDKSRYNNPIYILFDYGCDVTASKILIKELGIEKHVKWMPAMERKHIYAGLNKADLVTGIFNEHVISFGGVTFEAFSQSTPVIGGAKIQNATHDLPLIHALKVDEILKVLEGFQDNPQKFKEIGKRSRIWFDQHVGQGLVDRYIELIHLLIQHKEAKLEDKLFSHLRYSHTPP